MPAAPPLVCRSCRRSNDPWRRFCGGCGSGLPGGCASCGAVNRVDDRFCGGCAHPLRATPAPHTSTVPIDLADVIAEAPTR